MHRRFICRGGTPWPPPSSATRIVRKKGRPRSAAPTIALIIFILAGAVAAQESEETFTGFMHGIRANAVKGEVVYQRSDGSFPIETGLKLEIGDVIKTAPGACAEFLLQPGNYLRAGADTELQIINDQHDRMRIKLLRGTIIVEVLSKENLGSNYGPYEARYLVRALTPNAGVFMSEPGIFRINTSPAGPTELVVRNGSAVIKGQEVKAKRRAVVSGNDVAISEIDLKTEDAFDLWARERAETLVRANKDLKKTAPWAKNQKEDQEPSVDLPNDGQRSTGSALVVSARPGTVNFVDDGVEFSHAQNDWQTVTEKTHLEAGDKLRTEADSFTELTLFPDTNLRLAGSSEALFEQLSNDAVSIKILSGSAILDVARFDRKQAPQITIAAGSGGGSMTATIADSGDYRIDVDKITVRSGKVTFKERSIGSCRTIASEAVYECDKKRTDEFDYWSHYRGEGEFYDGLSMASYLTKTRQQRFQNTGFWFQQPGQTSYTFVPFRSEIFRSPYGGNYSTAVSPRRRLNRVNMGGRELRFP